MSRIMADGLKLLKEQIMESVGVDADNVVKVSILKSFCDNRGIKLKDLDRDVLESFNIDISTFVDTEVILEDASPIGDEFNIIRAINTNNSLLVLNELHRRGDSRAAKIQRKYLDFCESINEVILEDPTITKNTDAFISNMYEVFKSSLKKDE